MKTASTEAAGKKLRLTMMALAARSGRKGVMLSLGAFAVSFIFVLVIKDLNEKLAVMTASNNNYKRMTDQQLEKISRMAVRENRS